jgi:DNA-binding NarL/FixJ family response regulator
MNSVRSKPHNISMEKLKVVHVDDSSSYRRLLRFFLTNEPSIELVASLPCGIDLLERLPNIQCDIVLLDIQMPDLDGFDCAKILKERWPLVKVVILTNFDSPANIQVLYHLGVKSFLSKSNVDHLPVILNIIKMGGSYFPDQIGSALRNSLEPQTIPSILLNQQESLLLKVLGDGASSKEIGEILYKSPRTVEQQRENLYRKFNVENKEQLLVKASKLGFLG